MEREVQSSLNWQELAQALPGGVGIQQGGEMEYVSPVFAETVGTEREVLQGSPWELLFEPRTIEQVRTALGTVREDDHWQGDVWIGRTERVYVELTLSYREDKSLIVWSIAEKSPTEETDPANPERLLMGEPSRLGRTVLSTIDDVVYVIGDDGRFWFWNEQLAEKTGYSYEDIGEMNPRDFVPEDQYEYVPGLMQAIESIEDRRVRVDILTAEGERIPHEFSGTSFESTETGRSFRCGIARDISARLEREQKIRRQRDELATLNQINSLLFETTQEVIRTGNRGPIMQLLCEHAVETDLYQCAWVGQRERGTDRLTAVATEGFESEPGTVQVDPSAESDEKGIIEQAVDTDNPAVSICQNPSRKQQWEITESSGAEALVAVPLDHGDAVYGCLVLGTERANAFNSRELTALEVLGHLLGTVLHAARTQQLVFASTVVELEFEGAPGDPSPMFPATSFEGVVTLEGSLPNSEGWLLHLSTEGVPPNKAADSIQACTEVRRTRVITNGSESGRLEVILSSSPLLDVLTTTGASLQEATVSTDETRFVVTAPTDADVSHIVDRVSKECPEVDLLATRERAPDQMTNAQPDGLLDELTPRQREVLEVAYRVGYFSWPRESTAEEVAEALGIARSTVHAHLRKSELNILSELFEAPPVRT
ncbi:bacterio-opsin activator domain-containing protein [Halovenus rubra]|uniref:Bacterio-opsin activator domain-containing protein n=2 Tax=Halovenus rubra TaxID=869890 RepID=A0ACC7DYS5_9EURY|nr:bacterio-opsin activator domain-containing protein [Halovenus rubra]